MEVEACNQSWKLGWHC